MCGIMYLTGHNLPDIYIYINFSNAVEGGGGGSLKCDMEQKCNPRKLFHEICNYKRYLE